MKKAKLRQGISLLLALIPILVYGSMYQTLPSEIPSKFDFEGNILHYMSKNEFALIALLPLGFWLLFLTLPQVDPKQENYHKFSGVYQGFHFGMVVFLDFIFAMTFFSVFYPDSTLVGDLMLVAVAVLFVAIGNYLPQVKPNFFMGVRTPWTLSSETVWIKTHRVCGITFMLAGVLMGAIPFLGEGYGTIMGIGVTLLCLYPIGISYYYYKQEKTITTE